MSVIYDSGAVGTVNLAGIFHDCVSNQLTINAQYSYAVGALLLAPTSANRPAGG